MNPALLVPLFVHAATVAPGPCDRLPGLLRPRQADIVRSRFAECRVLEDLAERHGEEPETIVALGWHESRFEAKALSTGWAFGLLQVLPVTCRRWIRWGMPFGYSFDPRYLTPMGCDLLAAGAWTFGRFRERSKSLRWAVCRYTKGYNCDPEGTPRAWRWAGAVVRLRARLIKGRP